MKGWREAGSWYAYFGALGLAGYVWSLALVSYEAHEPASRWIADIAWGCISMLNARRRQIQGVHRMVRSSRLAPPGEFQDKMSQALADERSRINAERFHAFGLKRSETGELGQFLRRMAAFPEQIPKGNYYGMKEPPISALIDHFRLYTKNRKPYAAIFHPYTRINGDLFSALSFWTRQVGLDVEIDADSEYYPGVTLRVILLRQGAEFPQTNLA